MVVGLGSDAGSWTHFTQKTGLTSKMLCNFLLGPYLKNGEILCYCQISQKCVILSFFNEKKFELNLTTPLSDILTAIDNWVYLGNNRAFGCF